LHGTTLGKAPAGGAPSTGPDRPFTEKSAAGAPAASTEALARYGAALGLAFQIMDDILDLTQTTETLGKTAGRDVALSKSTYPSLLGVDGATERAEALIRDACAALSARGLLTPTLESMAHFVVRRSA